MTTTPITTKAVAKATKSAPAKVAPAAKAPKFGPDQCHWGAGSYLSPKASKRCQNKRNAKRQLCDEHEAAFRVARRARDEATEKSEKKAAGKSVSTVVELSSAFASPALAAKAKAQRDDQRLAVAAGPSA